jgi:hypothetical protein
LKAKLINNVLIISFNFLRSDLLIADTAETIVV